MYSTTLFIRKLGQCDWFTVSNAMHQFTEQRTSTTIDEIWLVEHDPIFTQGQSGKAEDLLMPGDIPVVQTDRGGQVTYHGPGQQVMYTLLDLKRRNMRVHKLIMILQETIISTLADYNIMAYTEKNLPGVYVGQGKNRGKICSLGLRIHKGCSLHGLALNVLMELSPFLRINPCGLPGMRMVQLSQFQANITTADVQPYLIKHFARLTNSKEIIMIK